MKKASCMAEGRTSLCSFLIVQNETQKRQTGEGRDELEGGCMGVSEHLTLLSIIKKRGRMWVKAVTPQLFPNSRWERAY